MTRHATERLLLALALSIGGGLTAVLAGIPEAALLVAPWLVLAAIGFSRPHNEAIELGIEIEDDRVLVGDDVAMTSSITLGSGGYAKLTRRFDPSFELDRAVVAPDVVYVETDEQVEITHELPALSWGAHDLGVVGVQILPPYGLFEMRGRLHRRSVVRVHPTPMQLRELVTPMMVRRVAGTHRSKVSDRGVEYADIREFGAGDSMRDINWQVSARSEGLWVSQRHPDRASDVILLVDSFVESGHDVRTVFGLAVEAAVALAESHLGATDRVGLIEFGGLIRWVTPGTGRVQLQRLTDALLATGLYANSADKELPILSPRTLPARSFVVALTPLLDQRFIDAVFTARARGHDVAVIECVSIDGKERPEALLPERLARELMSGERAILRDEMAQQGIAVAQWRQGDHLDVALGDLVRRRRRVTRVGGR